MRLLKKWVGSIYKRIALPFTHEHDVYYRKGRLWLLNRKTMMDEGLIKFKDYEDTLIDQARQLIEKHQITHLIDIGANLGYYTVQLGHLPQIREIHSFEPFPALYLQICANVLINNITEKWHGHRCALADHEGKTTLHYHPFYLGTSSLDSNWTERANKHIEVPVQRFDNCINSTGNRCYIKIDVEGSEIGVLKGMNKFLKQNNAVIQVESNEDNFPGIRSLLEDAGYKWLRNSSTNDHYFSNI